MVEYATPVWSPYTVQSMTQVEDVQRAFTRRLPGLSGLSYAERLNILGLQTLEHRRLLADLLMCYKIIHGHIALKCYDFFSFSSIIILVLHLRLSSKLPQRRMRLCSMLEKFSFKQFFKHRKS